MLEIDKLPSAAYKAGAITSADPMKATMLLLTALFTLGNAEPIGLITRAADKIRSDDLRVSPQPPRKGGTSPRIAFLPMQGLKPRGYLTQQPAKEPRLDSGKKSVASWAVADSASGVTQTRPESELVVPAPNLPQGYSPLNSSRARASAWKVKPAAENSPPANGINLQRLVRYFQTGRAVAGDAGASIPFRPPVKNLDFSKALEAPAQAR